MGARLTPEQFPLLTAPHLKLSLSDKMREHGIGKAARAADHIVALSDALQRGEIRNAALNEIKEGLSRCVGDAWEREIDARLLDGGLESKPEAIQELYWSIRVSGLHDAIPAGKRLGKSKATSPIIDAMKAFIAEITPLTLAVSELRDKAVKGRGIKPPALPVNPDKLVKTCSCCFRGIAVQGGERENRMVNHGYQRPGTGWQTASCPGTDFQSLEVSSVGLEWMIAAMRERLVSLEQSYGERGQKNTLNHLVRTRLAPGHYRDETVKIHPGDPAWDSEFKRYVSGLLLDIGGLKSHIPVLQERLMGWSPEKMPDELSAESTNSPC